MADDGRTRIRGLDEVEGTRLNGRRGPRGGETFLNTFELPNDDKLDESPRRRASIATLLSPATD